MTNSKSTKRALLTSALAMLMCVAMLIGTTFAWFTDTASTAVNKIQAGTLDVALEMKNADGEWESAEGKTLEFKKAAGSEGEAVLWEPGCTYELPELRVVNNGNLALKYKVIITGIKGDAKLNEAIEWTIGEVALGTEQHLTAGANNEFTIKGHMKEDAGNEYQNLSIDGISITVVATQDTVESDSYNNTYDENATYLNTDADGNILIGSAGDLRYFAATVNADNDAYAGKTIKLTSSIDLDGANWTPIVMTGTGADNGNQRVTFDGQGYTISNFKVNAAMGVHYTGFFGVANWSDIKNLTIDKATVSGINQVGAIVGRGMCTTIDSCKVTNSTITTAVWWDPAEKNGAGGYNDGDKAGAIAGWLDEGTHGAKNCTVDYCTITGYRDIAGLIGYVGNGSGSTATVTGNTVNNTTVTQVATNGYEEAIPVTVEKIVGRYYMGLDLAGNTATEVEVNRATE